MQVMHRDLKLANMLIGADGVLKVCHRGLTASETSCPVVVFSRFLINALRATLSTPCLLLPVHSVRSGTCLL